VTICYNRLEETIPTNVHNIEQQNRIFVALHIYTYQHIYIPATIF